MYFSSSTPTPPTATEGNSDLPWLLIYGFIVVLVLFFLYSAARYIVFLYLDPPSFRLFGPPAEIESDTASNFSNRDVETRDIEEAEIEETEVKQSITSRTLFDAVASRFETLLLSILSHFFRKKESKDSGVWHTGVHLV